jgi:hypothetical protein
VIAIGRAVDCRIRIVTSRMRTLSRPKMSSVLVRRRRPFWARAARVAPAGRRGRGVARGNDGAVLLRLAYLTVSNAFAVLRLLPMTDHDKDIEILALRHQLAVLQRQIGPNAVTFTPADRAFLAALLRPLPRPVLRRLRLIVRPDTEPARVQWRASSPGSGCCRGLM